MPDEQREASARELTDLYPAPKVVTIAGQAIEIKRCTIAQGGRIIDVGLPLWASLPAGMAYLDVLDERPAEVAALIVAATGLDAQWLAALDSADRADLVAAWLEVNAAFLSAAYCQRFAA